MTTWCSSYSSGQVHEEVHWITSFLRMLMWWCHRPLACSSLLRSMILIFLYQSHLLYLCFLKRYPMFPCSLTFSIFLLTKLNSKPFSSFHYLSFRFLVRFHSDSSLSKPHNLDKSFLMGLPQTQIFLSEGLFQIHSSGKETKRISFLPLTKSWKDQNILVREWTSWISHRSWNICENSQVRLDLWRLEVSSSSLISLAREVFE